MESTPRPFKIRDFTSDDYEAVAAMGNRVFPEYPSSADEFRHADESREAKCLHRRYIAEEDGVLLGHGIYEQRAAVYHPRKFEIEMMVHPEHQGRGIGRLLYEAIFRALEEHQPIALHTTAREDMPRPCRFFTDRGFEEVMRIWEMRANPQTLDLRPWSESEENLRGQGIRLVSFADLDADPEHARKAHALNDRLMRDVPLPVPATTRDFESWEKALRSNPNFLPEAYLFALDGDRYVGTTAIWGSQGNDDLYIGLSGTLAEYRRRGIAQALKVRSLAWAKERGATVVKTWNESANMKILRLNEKLGFVRQPAWIQYRKALREEEAPGS